MKSGELDKRRQRIIDAEKALAKAKEVGNVEDIKKHSSRIVKVDESHIDDCKDLLDVMGIPYIQAPSEAEAQCAELVKGEKVFGVGAEDMDALAFGCKILLRNLTTSETRNIPVREFNYDRILQDFKMSDHQFIDLCILIGCDYCEKINGIGPKRGIKLIQEHKCIENILKVIDTNKYIVPENWRYEPARQLFINPEVISASSVELQWKPPDIEGIVHLMSDQNGFAEGIVLNSAQKLLKLNRVLNKHSAKKI
jgi:flap endonuclease-1